MARHAEVEFLLRVGEYQAGSDPLADQAIERMPAMRALLQQGFRRGDRRSRDDASRRLLRGRGRREAVMTTVLPSRHEAQQLYRLRTLRVQRAREVCRQAQAAVERAEEAVRAAPAPDRPRASSRSTCCGRPSSHALAPRLPRWSTMAVAQREALADRLERDEYALIDDEQQLEEAQETLQRRVPR